jgi:hypothetical protein
MRRFPALLVALLALVPAARASQAQEVRGQGPRSSEPFPLEAGPARFDVEHTGQGAFRVRLLDDTGALVAQLADGEGLYRDARDVVIPRAGRYRYEVVATGPWAVGIHRAVGSTPAAGAPLAPGRIAGMEAARDVEAVRWMGTGLLGGALLGPIGAAVNVVLAGGRDVAVPEPALAAARARGPDFAEAFEEGYRSRVRSNRRTGALIGGATGSLVFGFVVLQVVNWGGGSGGTPPGGGGNPASLAPAW